jgi:bacterioferritin-associated ferredoxin
LQLQFILIKLHLDEPEFHRVQGRLLEWSDSRMYVCICANVTDRQIKQAVRDGVSSLGDLTAHLGVGAGCGCCREVAQDVLDAALEAPVAAPIAGPAIHAREIARVAAPARPV